MRDAIIMFKTIINVLIVLSFTRNLINGQGYYSVDVKDKMCQDKHINDDKMNIYIKEMMKCHEKVSCIGRADDIDVTLNNSYNKQLFAMRCSKKYIECEINRQEKYRELAKMTLGERTEMSKEMNKGLNVCIKAKSYVILIKISNKGLFKRGR